MVMCVDCGYGRLVDLAGLLFMADMSVPENAALRTEAYEILDTLDRVQREDAYNAAVREYVRLSADFDRAVGDKVPDGMYKGSGVPMPVVVDFGAVEKVLGRALTRAEDEALALKIDADACGRSVAETQAACMVFRGGEPDPAARSVLKRLSRDGR